MDRANSVQAVALNAMFFVQRSETAGQTKAVLAAVSIKG